MIINRETKKGNIAEIDIEDVKIFIAGLGVIAIGSVALFAMSNQNQKYDYSNNQKLYSESIEDMFDVSLTDEQAEEINNFEKYSTILNNYDNAPETEKRKYVEQMIEESYTLEDDILLFVKNKVAKKHGGEGKDYVISNTLSKKEESQWIAKRAEENGIVLNMEQSDIINKRETLIACREDLNLDDERTYKDFVNSYRKLIRADVKSVKKEAARAK